MAQVLIFGSWDRVKDLQNEVMRKVSNYGLIRKEDVKEALAEIESKRPPVLIVIDEAVSDEDRAQIQDTAQARGIKTTLIDPTNIGQRQHLIRRLQGGA